jgi:hypothetical protein
MKNEVNVQRSKLFPDGMLHIEFLDGNSYLYSLEEIADIIAAQPSVQADGLMPCPGEPAGKFNPTVEVWSEMAVRFAIWQAVKSAQPSVQADGARVCPECDGAVEFCAMSHYVPAAPRK